MCLLWELAGTAFYATAITREGGATLHLIVEALPEQEGWDWAIWRQGLTNTLRQGEARSASAAIQTAEKSLPTEFRSTLVSA
jgi:hypothetical protein